MASSIATQPRSSASFDVLAEAYDESFTHSLIGRAQRSAVWKELDSTFTPGERILEINCGTGFDAAHLASRGVEVLACDASPGMIEVARRRLKAQDLSARLQFRVLPTEAIASLSPEGPFDGALSNFGGLNCLSDLAPVARALAALLRPRARALLCLMGRFCAWEIAWYVAHGQVRKAFRRLRRQGAVGHLADGVTVHVRYYSARELARVFAPHLRLAWWRGIGVAVPPTYAEAFVRRHPKILDRWAAADARLGRFPVARGMADHILLCFERAPA